MKGTTPRGGTETLGPADGGLKLARFGELPLPVRLFVVVTVTGGVLYWMFAPGPIWALLRPAPEKCNNIQLFEDPARPMSAIERDEVMARSFEICKRASGGSSSGGDIGSGSVDVRPVHVFPG